MQSFDFVILTWNAWPLIIVVTLTLGLWSRLRHERRSKPKTCLKIQTHSHICGKVNPNIPKCFHTLKIKWCYEIWGKKANNKWCPNWNFFKLLKRLWNVSIKYGLAFFIWKYETLVMVEKWLEIKLTIWLLTIKIWEVKVKWPLN